MFPQALQLVEQYPDKDGDYCIGLITSKTMCSVLEVSSEEGSEQTSIYVEEGDQNGQDERRSGNHITHDLLAKGPNPTRGEDLQEHRTVVSKYLRG